MRLSALWPFRGNGIPTYEVDTIVSRGTNVRGDLRGPGGFRVDGAVTGSVEAEGAIVIGEDGAVEGAVKGRDVVVLGRVHGDVVATGHLEIGPKGRVMGDVTVVSLKVHAGGTFQGASRIGEGAGAPRLTAATNPIGILPVAPLAPKAKGQAGRTLPPPLGAVPPPPPSPAVTSSSPAITETRSAPRESGEARIEPPRKVAAND